MKVSSVSVRCIVMALILAAASAWPTWNVDSDSEEYSTFLNSLREELGRGTPEICNRPITSRNNVEKYVLVNLVIPFNGKTITLALRASNAHLVGFQDRVSESNVNKLRANFFSDEYTKLSDKYTSIFPDANVLGPAIPCESRDTDLEKKAGVSRTELIVGVSDLRNAITAVHGKDFTGENVAKFALISIQMVVEAAKFRYIENQVKNRGMRTSFEVGVRLVFLGYNWQIISLQFEHIPNQCRPQHGAFTEEEMDLGLLLFGISGLNSNDGHPSLAVE